MPESPYIALWKRLRRYFRDYGGRKAVFASPLFGVALFSTLLNYSYWIKGIWPQTTFALVPSLLGFSLGTYAILFSLMTTRLKQALKSKINSEGIPYLNEINATFFHFIFIQIIALLWAIAFEGSWLVDIKRVVGPYITWEDSAFNGLALTGSFIGFFLLLYSVLLILAAALAVYRIAGLVDPQGP